MVFWRFCNFFTASDRLRDGVEGGLQRLAVGGGDVGRAAMPSFMVKAAILRRYLSAVGYERPDWQAISRSTKPSARPWRTARSLGLRRVGQGRHEVLKAMTASNNSPLVS